VGAGLLFVAAAALPFALNRTELGVCVIAYVVIMISYSRWLKHEPVDDLVLVASGFLLRAMAGGLSAKLPLSSWFLIVTAFGSLFIVAGKRYSEHVMMGEVGSTVRKSLGEYSATYLRFVWTTSAGVLVTGYCLWAFEVSGRESGGGSTVRR